MSLFDRLRGKPTATETAIMQQLATMQDTVTNLAAYNNVLQQAMLQQQFRAQGGFLRADTNSEINYIRTGYQVSAAVYSICSYIAQKAVAIPLKVYEVTSDTELKNYIGLRQLKSSPENKYRVAKTFHKALKEVGENNPVQKLIDRPNSVDNTSFFFQTSALFRLITGNSYWYMPTLDKGADKGKISELFIMPSQFTLLYVTNYYPQRVIGYELIIDGVRLLNTMEVAHSKYTNLDWSVDGQQLYGMSPLKALARTLTRSNDSETAAIAQLENGGPAVIIANKSISSDDFGTEQIGKSKEQFKREYSGATNKAKVKMMAGDISVQSLGISPVELDLLAGEERVFAMICNGYHVSDTLFNNHSASTESNVKEMRKDSYTSAIIPERQAQADLFNNYIAPTFNKTGKRWFVDLDLSGIPELQPDNVSMAQWMNLFPWASPNEKRELFDFGKSPDPNMDKIWIPTGYTTMDDASIQVDELPDPEAAQEDLNA